MASSLEPSSAELTIRVESAPENIGGVRRAVEDFCRNAGFDEPAIGDVGLAVNEALANVIRHAYAGATDRPMIIQARCVKSDATSAAGTPGTTAGDLAVEIRIRDWGNGVDPDRLPPRPRDPLMPGGLGLICMRQMMDQVMFAPQADGMLLVMVRLKDRPSRCSSSCSGSEPTNSNSTAPATPTTREST